MTDETLIEVDRTIRETWDAYRIEPTYVVMSAADWYAWLRQWSRAFRRREELRGYPFAPLVLESIA